MKKLILVTSPPACGKTYVSKELAKALKPIVYLDKDTLIKLSKQVFYVANEPYNRSSAFFEQFIRDYEYEVIVDLALEALEYSDTVLINAPFTREVRNKAYMEALKEMLASKDAILSIIWVETSVDICHQRMIERNSSRDAWKLEHWDEYIQGCDFTPPEGLNNPSVKNDFLIFKNSSQLQFEHSLSEVVHILQQV